MRSSTVFGLANAALALFVLAGCGDTLGVTVPVSGKVEVDGTPLATGTLTYVADEAKGNKLQAAVAGQVTNGQYSLHTTGTTIDKPGAPPGWYKVIVETRAPPGATVQKSAQGPKIDRKYSDPKSTPWNVEVKADAPAGHYDLKVTNKK